MLYLIGHGCLLLGCKCQLFSDFDTLVTVQINILLHLFEIDLIVERNYIFSPACVLVDHAMCVYLSHVLLIFKQISILIYDAVEADVAELTDFGY